MSGFGIMGNIHATMVDIETGERKVWTAQNTITSGGLSFLRDFLAASVRTMGTEMLISGAPLPPTYIALGSGINGGAWQASRFMTVVPGEHFRGSIATRDASGQSVIFHAHYSSADGNGPAGTGMTIGAYGIYAGNASNAPAYPGSGTLFAVAREPVPFGKRTSNTIDIDWTITVSGKL